VAELHLKLGLTSGAKYESIFKVPSPTANTDILFRMLHTHLENVRTDAPINFLCLAAIPGQPEAHQFGLFETTLRNPNQFAETLARLEALCGPNRVGTPILEPTLRPDSFRMKPPEFCGSSGRKIKRSALRWGVARKGRILNEVKKRQRTARTPRPGGGLGDPELCDSVLECVQSSAAFSASLHLGHRVPVYSTCNLQPATCNPPSCGLQLRRFRPPLEAQLEVRDELPLLIRSSVCNGAIADRRGPFCSSGNWWDDGRWWRKEWDIQMSDGTIYRIFLTERSRQANEADSEQMTTSSPRPSPPKEEREKDIARSTPSPPLEERAGERKPTCHSASLPRRLQCFIEGVYD
jgi:protein ImuB